MKYFLPVIFVGIIAFLAFYLTMPVMAWGFMGFPFLILILTLFFVVLSSSMAYQPINKNKKQGQLSGIQYAGFAIVALMLVYLIVVPIITSWPLFHHQKYRNLIGEVVNGEDLSKHIAPISLEKIRVVDESLANVLGDKVIGAQPALGSQVNLGTFNIQKVNDELYWVAPLLHSGFFKWRKNSEGTNGYVMISATNERDVRLVQEVGGEPVSIRYQPEAYFSDNLERYLYFNGYCSTGLTDYTFELDDTGKPYWVVTKYKKTIGFGGNEAVGVVIVDTKTGEINEFEIADTPVWVDRIQPDEFVAEQLNDWGEYVKGFWNFSNENKLQITEGLTLVYGEDNRAYWYTGLTSVGADESTVGFVLVDTRTKESVWYRQSGATEYAAQLSAMGKVQEKGYRASLPIPYNINNIPTYIMTLKDNGGLVKMFGMVSINDYTIVGVGNTLRETMMAYKNAFNMADNRISPQSETSKIRMKSVISRIGSDMKNGNSFYYFMLVNNPQIFIGSSQISNEFPVTSVGDSVSVVFDNDLQDVVDVSEFRNISVRNY
jgi:hypothetical protein